MSRLRIQQTGSVEVQPLSDGRITLSVPVEFKRRGGRKLVTLPNGQTMAPRPSGTAPTPLQQALARGYRWRTMLETGEAKYLSEIATREGVDNSYVSRMVNLTLLAPDIVAEILDDALPDHITLSDLAIDPPVLWAEQRAELAVQPRGLGVVANNVLPLGEKPAAVRPPLADIEARDDRLASIATFPQ